MGSQLIAASSMHRYQGDLRQSQTHQYVQEAESTAGKSSIVAVRPELETDHMIPHAIFLSHSGKQKGFAKDLYNELSLYFSTFFDIKRHSLPPGEPFPPRIFEAAKSCKVALVLLSDDYVRSKWPMMELSTFVKTAESDPGSLKLLPLFFELSPDDLKSEFNLKEWREAWKTSARQDGKGRIDPSSMENALKTLSSQNGLIFDRASGEQTYIHQIMEAVSVHVPFAFKFSGSHVSGKDRLCKVILDKFEDMELHDQMLSHPQSSSSTPAASAAQVSVLGIYGLPGSGKTTLCKCLVDHFRSLYSQQVVHLELPSTPTDADMVKQFKKLLRLTNFRGRVSLDEVSHVEQVEHLLRSSHFSSCRVFLVVDNISDKSVEEVRRIIRLGVGHGSKIILVARTLSILRSIFPGPTKSRFRNCVCDSMPVPSINEKEAIEILLQFSRDCSVALDKNSLLQSITLRQLETIRDIVRKCSYRDVPLPLLMKAMGARFRKYSIEDLEGCDSGIKSLWERVETYKQDAVVVDLLGENFKILLDKNLQLMFLDVALFILQIGQNFLEKVTTLLSWMHGVDSNRIKMKIKDLERHCFLEISEGSVTIHDVYMDFAKTIQDDPSKYIAGTSISCRWQSVPIADASDALRESSSYEKCELRTLILRGGENCARVDLQGLSGLKAVALMNCKSLLVLGLAGLSSLAILNISDCAMLQRIECDDRDYASLVHLKSLDIFNYTKPEKKRNALAPSRVQTWEQVPYVHKVANFVKSIFLFAPFRHPVSLELGLLASHMRSLQNLSLMDSGTIRLELDSCSLPQLRSLTIRECYLEKFALGNFPSLSDFTFFDTHASLGFRLGGDVFSMISLHTFRDYKSTEMWRRKEGQPRFLLPGKDLFCGCPQLRNVMISSAFFKQGQLGSLPTGLVTFQMDFFYTATELPDLSLSAHTLERLDVGWCEKLESVNLVVRFRSLKTLSLRNCNNLVEVTAGGLGCLPNLRTLIILNCHKLQQLTGFDSAHQLQWLILNGCFKLGEISSSSSFKNLKGLQVKRCPRLRSQVARADYISELENLSYCDVEVCGQYCLSLRNCMGLKSLKLEIYGPANGTGELELRDLQNLKCLNSLQISGRIDSSNVVLDQRPPLKLEKRVHDATPKRLGFSSMVRVAPNRLPGSHLEEVSRDCLPVRSLELSNLDVLDNMDGVEHLCKLTRLSLHKLRSLRSLQGIASLSPLLKELPSMQAMEYMHTLYIRHCPKLKAVDGCDCLERLQDVGFEGCEAMERCPLTDDNLYKRCLEAKEKFRLNVDGCAFASNVEAMTAWAASETPNLRSASLFALLWEYDHPHYIVSANNAVNNHKQQVKEALLRFFSPEMIQEAMRRLALERRSARALDGTNV